MERNRRQARVSGGRQRDQLRCGALPGRSDPRPGTSLQRQQRDVCRQKLPNHQRHPGDDRRPRACGPSRTGWDTSDPADWKIYIANPNSPPSGGFSDELHPTNIIHVDSQSNTFSFEFGGPTDVWTGGTWTGGRMYVMPFSIACTEQHTPFWDVALILLGAAVLILGGDAQTSQISDDHGRTFYTPQAAGPPIRWSDITPDGPNVVPGMARLPLIAESQPGQPDALRATDAAVAADATSPGRIAREPGTTLQPGQAPPTSVAEPQSCTGCRRGHRSGTFPCRSAPSQRGRPR